MEADEQFDESPNTCILKGCPTQHQEPEEDREVIASNARDAGGVRHPRCRCCAQAGEPEPVDPLRVEAGGRHVTGSHPEALGAHRKSDLGPGGLSVCPPTTTAHRDVAQMEERRSPKPDVAGSNPVVSASAPGHRVRTKRATSLTRPQWKLTPRPSLGRFGAPSPDHALPTRQGTRECRVAAIAADCKSAVFGHRGFESHRSHFAPLAQLARASGS